jgi:hypothetical protein
VVQEQELEHRVLALARLVGRRAALHDHAVGGGHRARGLELRHRPAAHLDLDEAHAAGADRRSEPRLVAEHRDLDADLRRRHHERRARRHVHLAPVERDRDERDLGRRHQTGTTGSVRFSSG